MSQSRTPTRRSQAAERPEPRRTRRESASTAAGLVAERAALADRQRRTAQAMTAARRLGHAAEPRA
jgi:hypothetical protein